MYVDKVLLTIVLCSTSAWCVDDSTLTRTARTIGSSSSFLTWPPQISKSFWIGRPILWEWTRNGAVILIHLASLVSTSTAPMRIEFRPEDGPRAAEAYRRRFGYRGEWLIEQLGNGLGPNTRPHGQSVPNTYLSPPLSLFRSGSNFF